MRTAGPQRLTGLRDNDRAAFADAELAAELWQLLRPFVPGVADGATPVGLDDKFRFYRYVSSSASTATRTAW